MIVALNGLTVEQLPDFITVCARVQELKMRVWRGLLQLSATLHKFGGIQASDTTGFDHHSASRHYANCMDLGTLRNLRVNLDDQ